MFRGKYDRGVPWVFCGESGNDPGHRPWVLSRVVASGGPEGEARRRSPKAKPEGEARRRSPKAKPEGEAPPKSRPILLTPLKRPTPTNTENSAQRTPSGGGTARKPQTNAEKARPIARRARAAAAAEAEARRGNRTPRRHQPRAHSKTGRRYLEDKQTRRGPEKQKVLFRVPMKPRAPARTDDPRRHRPMREIDPPTRLDHQTHRGGRQTHPRAHLPRITGRSAGSSSPAQLSSGLCAGYDGGRGGSRPSRPPHGHARCSRRGRTRLRGRERPPAQLQVGARISNLRVVSGYCENFVDFLAPEAHATSAPRASVLLRSYAKLRYSSFPAEYVLPCSMECKWIASGTSISITNHSSGVVADFSENDLTASQLTGMVRVDRRPRPAHARTFARSQNDLDCGKTDSAKKG